MERAFTARDRFWQNVILHVRPALVASWIKRFIGLRRRDIETRYGIFHIDPVSQFAMALTSTRGYEPEISGALAHFLKSAATFVDIGANEGFFAVMASKLVGATGKIIAVEPQTRLKTVVERNFQLNRVSNATLLPYAISDREGTVELFVSPDTNTGSTALHRTTRYPLHRETVTVTTLSKLFESAGIHTADLVKMDIEGAEFEAVLGSPDLFKSHRIKAFVFELHHAAISSRGRDPAAVERFLESCGYTVAQGLSATVWVSPEQRGG